jgi:hypothetical protein
VGAMAAGILLVFTPIGRLFSFVAMPMWFVMTILGIVVAYFVMAELVKRVVYPRIGLVD